jgi:glucuronate isomerase
MTDSYSTRILPVANADNILSCCSLQADYAELQQKYTDLKEKKIQGLDGMLEEHSAKLAAHNETAVKLADHWRQKPTVKPPLLKQLEHQLCRYTSYQSLLVTNTCVITS